MALLDSNSLHLENYQRFSNLFGYMSIGLVICRTDGSFLEVNDSFCKITGYTQEELLEISFREITHPEDLDIDLANVKLLLEGKITNYSLEKRYIRKDKSILWINLHVSIIPDSNNVPEFIIGTIEDITDQKKAEETIRVSEDKFAKLFGSSPDAIMLTRISDGLFVEVNDSACRISGYSREEMIGNSSINMNFWVIPEERNRYVQELTTNNRVSNFEAEFRVKSGEIKKTIIAAEIIQLQGSSYILSVIHDISERKKAEEALIYTKQLLSEMSKIAKIGAWEFDVETMTGTWTDEVARIHELPPEADTSVELGLIFYEGESRIKMERAVKDAIEHGIPYDLEVEITTAKGNRKWVRTIAQVVWNGEKVGKVYGSFQDITERVLINLELLRAKEKAEESDMLKSAFLHNMSHEIRTPLNAIMGFSDLLSDSFENKDNLLQFAGIIKQRGADLLEIINDILDIAKIESGQLPVNIEKCRLSTLFSEIHTLYNEFRLRKKNQQIDFNLEIDNAVGDKLFNLDRVKLKQIINNLVSNAFKFTHFGKIELGCKLEDDFLLFYVSDTGIDIPDNKKETIFDRFVQANTDTSLLYGGTGLGLSIVQGLLKLVGGTIWLESVPGKGSTFYFTFPYKLIENEGFETPTKPETKSLTNSKISILLVEDDIFNAKYLKEILSATGATVLHTEFGQDAVALVQTTDFDLVLMDVRLPDISGYEATRLIKQHKPEIKIIAQTAYAMSSDKQMALESGCDSYVSKPIKKAELFEVISNVLAGK